MLAYTRTQLGEVIRWALMPHSNVDFFGDFFATGHSKTSDIAVSLFAHRICTAFFLEPPERALEDIQLLDLIEDLATLDWAYAWSDELRARLSEGVQESDIFNRLDTRARRTNTPIPEIRQAFKDMVKAQLEGRSKNVIAEAQRTGKGLHCRGCGIETTVEHPFGVEERNGVRATRHGIQQPFQHLSVDRILPGALGGRYVADNMQPLCWADILLKWTSSQDELLIRLQMLQQQLHPQDAARFEPYTFTGRLFGAVMLNNQPLGSAAEPTPAEEAAILRWIRKPHQGAMLSQGKQDEIEAYLRANWVGSVIWPGIGRVELNLVRESYGLVVPLEWCDLDRIEPGSSYEDRTRVAFFVPNRLRRNDLHDHRPCSWLIHLCQRSEAERLTTYRRCLEAVSRGAQLTSQLSVDTERAAAIGARPVLKEKQR